MPITNRDINKIPHMAPKIRGFGTTQIQHPEDAYNEYWQPKTSIPANRAAQNLDINNDIHYEKPTYSPPTQVSKGLTSSQSATGSFVLYDATGGTKLFSYNAMTGVITIAGSLVANQVNTGTYSNITLAGNDIVVGTMQNGVYGTVQLTGGTLNPGVYQTGGTAGLSGTTAFVRSVSPGTVLGSLIFNNGLLIGTS